MQSPHNQPGSKIPAEALNSDLFDDGRLKVINKTTGAPGAIEPEEWDKWKDKYMLPSQASDAITEDKEFRNKVEGYKQQFAPRVGATEAFLGEGHNELGQLKDIGEQIKYEDFWKKIDDEADRQKPLAEKLFGKIMLATA